MRDKKVKRKPWRSLALKTFDGEDVAKTGVTLIGAQSGSLGRGYGWINLARELIRWEARLASGQHGSLGYQADDGRDEEAFP